MDRLPLFPLRAVLFPGGRLPLRVFEQRYLDMVSACLKADTGFGVCLIEHGHEVGEAAAPYRVGTEARIVEWDMARPGILEVVAHGARRFRIIDHEVRADKLQVADVQWLEGDSDDTVPDEFAHLVRLLQSILQEIGQDYYFGPARLDRAAWVANRLGEFLPIDAVYKQKLLEVDGAVARLAAITDLLRYADEEE